jgi:hypothetical protein
VYDWIRRYHKPSIAIAYTCTSHICLLNYVFDRENDSVSEEIAAISQEINTIPTETDIIPKEIGTLPKEIGSKPKAVGTLRKVDIKKIR